MAILTGALSALFLLIVILVIALRLRLRARQEADSTNIDPIVGNIQQSSCSDTLIGAKSIRMFPSDDAAFNFDEHNPDLIPQREGKLKSANNLVIVLFNDANYAINNAGKAQLRHQIQSFFVVVPLD